jgi:hypothetical protein
MMKKSDLLELPTLQDLYDLEMRLVEKFNLISRNNVLKKEFYSPKEFASITGKKYSTVIHHCKIGKLKSRQDNPKSSWQIDASELERFKKEAEFGIWQI